MNAPRGHWLPTALKALFALVMIGGMALLFVMISAGAKDAQRAIDVWATRVRGGEPVTAAVGASEADALTALLRNSTSNSMSNFQSQSGSTCVWVTFDDPKHTEVQVLLVEVKDEQVVAQASIGRECDCPDDSERCHLK